MNKMVQVNANKIAIINGLGIWRSENRKTDYFGAQYGPRYVYYDVALDYGEGDVIESFKTESAARHYCQEY